jgi:hypothetical protein
MTDRELLEAAAKAAGYQLESEPASVWVVGENSLSRVRFNELGGHSIWNPLTDDGDALRLAVKLGIEIGNYHQYDRALAFIGSQRGSGEYWEVSDDPAAATRRAIVRAAAAMAG